METTRRPFGPFPRWEVSAARIALTCGVFVVVLACLGSAAGLPDYSPWRNFVSELSLPRNPLAWRLNVGFMTGGTLISIGLATLGRRLEGPLRVAAWLGAASAISFAMVGVFPIDTGARHVAAAGSAILASVVASIFFLVGVSRVSGLSAARKRLVLGFVSLELAAVVLGSAAAWWLVESGRTPARYLFFSGAGQIANPLARGKTINPIAIAEWTLLISALALVVAIVIGAPAVLNRSLDQRATARDHRQE